MTDTAENYSKEFKVISDKIKLIEYEQVILRAYRNGLRVDVRERVDVSESSMRLYGAMNSEPVKINLTFLMKMAKQYDSIVKPVEKPRISTTKQQKKHCEYCNKDYHDINECRLKQRNESITCYYCKERGHTSIMCQKKKLDEEKQKNDIKNNAIILNDNDKFGELITTPCTVDMLKLAKETTKGGKEDKHYDVERILSDKMIDGAVHYLVKWKGYNNKSNTWQTVRDFDDLNTVKKYWKMKNGGKGSRRY